MATGFDERAARLEKFFLSAIKDETRISSAHFATLFIEAVCSCFADGAILADKLLTGKGLLAMRRAVQIDLSPAYINKWTSQLLLKLADPTIASIDHGRVLAHIIKHLLQPTFFWTECVQHVKNKAFDDETLRGVAWLLFQGLTLLPLDDFPHCVNAAEDTEFLDHISKSSSAVVRSFGYQIRHCVAGAKSHGLNLSDEPGPGGRHDNDHKDIAHIRLMPTRDEILSDQPPFLRKAAEVFGHTSDTSPHYVKYVDNMFRMLREDMLVEVRDKSDTKRTQVTRRGVVAIPPAMIRSVNITEPSVKPWERRPWTVCFALGVPLPGLEKMTVVRRSKYLKDFSHVGSRILPSGSLIMISIKGEAAGFGYVDRDIDRLSADKAEILVALEDSCRMLMFEHASKNGSFDLSQSQVPAFAYKPFLRRLQTMQCPPLCDAFLDPHADFSIPRESQSIALLKIIQDLQSKQNIDLRQTLRVDKEVVLDAAQRAAVTSGLSQKISLIQGPPGTGKSFIGSLITRALYDHLEGSILVICYTNHALDQFTEDLIDIGIPLSAIVRLGSKSSARTEELLLRRQRQNTVLSKVARSDVQCDIDEMNSRELQMHQVFRRLQQPCSMRQILQHLEFSKDSAFFQAFQVRRETDSMKVVGRKGRSVREDYLLRRWLYGDCDPGVFSAQGTLAPGTQDIWQIPLGERRTTFEKWKMQIREYDLECLVAAGNQHDTCQARVRKRYQTGDALVVASKRIIACTSTSAAMSSDILAGVNPKVIVLEEAGELLEPHVLASLHKSTERLIMVGDHKQLRPKILSYPLQVESGEGYDLNRSLFERLILRGIAHTTLSEQHRMRPEIAGLVRHLIYPDLQDAPSTINRPDIRGLQQNVIFVDHQEPESALEVRNTTMTASKQNQYEATLAMRYVKYLAQQGYGSNDLVVLTPYLGQLRLLQQTISIENDPVLNDLDNHDLFAAGLLAEKPATNGGRKVHISSIDNYQGEEKKIVIVSLTRSNSNGDIGFMSQPERLNVLLSRARDGLIIIGNLATFTTSKKGGQLWSSLRQYMSEKKQVLRGLPVQCQKHPGVKNVLVLPQDFEKMCPDGGCSQPCNEMLSCGKHKCRSSCHILIDHSKIPCHETLKDTCAKGHTIYFACNIKAAPRCTTCVTLDQKRLQVAKQRAKKQAEQETDQRRYDERMADLEAQIESSRLDLANAALRQEQSLYIAAKEKDLARILEQAQNAQAALRPGSTSAEVSNCVTTKPKKGSQTEPPTPTCPASLSQDPTTTTVQNVPYAKPASIYSSPAQQEWDRQKRVELQSNEAIDSLMGMVGLENVKQYVLDVKSQIQVKKRQNVTFSCDRYHAAFIGNPGTGKTSVARLWAKLLFSLEVLPGEAFEENTGSNLASRGIATVQDHLDRLTSRGGGVMFIDEAYQLTDSVSAGGRLVLDFLLAEIENRRDKIVFVFAGYRRPMEAFYSHNPGIRSRIPHQLHFEDYSESELLVMLQKLFKKRFTDRAKIEGDEGGLYMRIVARRLSRQRGNDGFGNMRDLENIFTKILNRQASRLSTQRREGLVEDDLAFTAQDLIGPEPTSALLHSSAWKRLESLIGLAKVKDSVRSLVSILKTNYDRELQEIAPIQICLNKVFLGNPGTGKTSVARLYGQLLAEIGILSDGDVLEKTAGDFIGAVLGASEKATTGILESAKGKVLIIDEAYMLNPVKTPGNGTSDPFRTAVIDTIVSKVHNVPGDDQCVILLGYKEEMEAMYQQINPGFSRRFPLADAFCFDDFTEDELRKIFQLKLKDQDLIATQQGEETAIEELSRMKNKPHFGNAGEVENVINKAKINWQRRISLCSDSIPHIDSVDFNPDFERSKTASIRLQDLFKDSVGSDDLIAQLSQYQTIAANLKARGRPLKDHIPFNFIFKGPPGTGKTTTARKIGQVYYDMGLLSSTDVVECSVSELVAEYVGQTGPKTEKQLEKGLGKVLFIDEAYRLGEGHFATEAVNELTDLLTKPKFKGKLIVVLAGYEDEMDNMLAVNPGLSSRFSEVVFFRPLSPEQCVTMFRKQLDAESLSCASLDDVSSHHYKEIVDVFVRLTSLKFWGNGRDVENLSKKAMRFVYGRTATDSDHDSMIPHAHILTVLEEELHSRRKMEAASSPNNKFNALGPQSQRPPIQGARSTEPPPSSMSFKQLQDVCEDEQMESIEEATAAGAIRDVGVSDADWDQLQADIAAAAQRAVEDNEAMQSLTAQESRAESTLVSAEGYLGQCERAAARNAEADDAETEESQSRRRQALKELEKARLQVAKEASELARAAERAAREKERQEHARKKEQAMQQKLRQMGVCVRGFRWIKQHGGYRCAGGSHFVGDDQLGHSGHE